MDKKFKEKDALLKEHKETTLEKNQAKRIARRAKMNELFNKVVKDPF